MIAHSQISVRRSAVTQLNGFTLVELLVVSSVIAILSALLLPALGQAKNQAHSAQCMNNLHEMAIAMTVYTEDYGAYPLATTNGVTGAWQPALQTECPALKFCCPTQVNPSSNFTSIFAWTSGPISPYYGYNVFGAAYRGTPPYNPGLGGDVDMATATRTPTPVNRVVAPAQMIAVGDSATFAYVGFGPQPQSNIPKQIYLAFPYALPGFDFPGVGNWHDGGANVLFADAHVEIAQQSHWIAATDASRSLWNSDHQAHEEWW